MKATKTTVKIYCNRCKWYNYWHDYCEVGWKHPLFARRKVHHKGYRRIEYINDRIYNRYFPNSDRGFSELCEANENYDCPFFVRRWYILWGPRRGPKHLIVELLNESNK